MTGVVGLDLSLTATGIATADGTRIVASTGRKDATLAERRARLTRVVTDIEDAVNDAWTPGSTTFAFIEAPSFGQARQGGTHDRAGLWWLTVDTLFTMGITVVEVPPATLKKYVTGKGNAKKPDMRMAIFKRFGVDIADDNEGDAFGLRALGLDLLGRPLVDMPAINRSALDKLTLPEGALR